MSEHDEQVALFQWAEVAQGTLPELALMFAIPNAGGYTGGYKQNVRRVAAMKREGVKSGVPDICLPVARGPYHGLYIELKAGKNKATPSQLEWLEALARQRYFTTVCVGWEAARDVLAWYVGGASRPLGSDLSWRTQVRNALASGMDTISVIKLCRSVSGMGLKEAKDAVLELKALDAETFKG
jgi:hypothetical protein